MTLFSLGDNWDDKITDRMWKFNVGSCSVDASNTHIVPLPSQEDRKVFSRAG